MLRNSSKRTLSFLKRKHTYKYEKKIYKSQNRSYLFLPCLGSHELFMEILSIVKIISCFVSGWRVVREARERAVPPPSWRVYTESRSWCSNVPIWSWRSRPGCTCRRPWRCTPWWWCPISSSPEVTGCRGGRGAEARWADRLRGASVRLS